MTRPSFDETWMRVAHVVARRATCDRKHVGAVIVRDNKIVATGYNGAPRGMPHCDDVGHELKEINGRMSCVRTLHAESNALDQAGHGGAEGSTLYVTCEPCYPCSQRAVNARVRRVVYAERYQSQNTELARALFKRASIRLDHLPLSDAEAQLKLVITALETFLAAAGSMPMGTDGLRALLANLKGEKI